MIIIQTIAKAIQMIQKKVINKKMTLVMCTFLFSNTSLLSQFINNTSVYNIYSYSNENFYWEPTGPARKLDSDSIFCVIRTNVIPDSTWYKDSIKVVFWRNLNDTSKDFATHVILANFYYINCCQLIDGYFILKNSQIFWRRKEKEFWLSYWKTFLNIN